MAQILHNIRKLAFIETRLLKNITIIHGAGVFMNYWRNFHNLPIVGLGQYEVTSKIENKSRLYTHTISVLLAEHFDIKERHLAFLLTCVNGEQYLVGSPEHPFPLSNVSDSFPGKVNEPAGCSLSVEYIDTLGLLPVLD